MFSWFFLLQICNAFPLSQTTVAYALRSSVMYRHSSPSAVRIYSSNVCRGFGKTFLYYVRLMYYSTRCPACQHFFPEFLTVFWSHRKFPPSSVHMPGQSVPPRSGHMPRAPASYPPAPAHGCRPRSAFPRGCAPYYTKIRFR